MRKVALSTLVILWFAQTAFADLLLTGQLGVPTLGAGGEETYPLTFQATNRGADTSLALWQVVFNILPSTTVTGISFGEFTASAPFDLASSGDLYDPLPSVSKLYCAGFSNVEDSLPVTSGSSVSLGSVELIVPAGATGRIDIGIVPMSPTNDGSGWFPGLADDDGGSPYSFAVPANGVIASVGAAPEPASNLILLSGAVAVWIAGRTRHRPRRAGRAEGAQHYAQKRQNA
jgi:hypothetical protein